MLSRIKSWAVPLLTLFTSSSTLFCCALPALFVALGMGSTVASTFSAFPQLGWIGENKPWVFGGAGLMLLIAGALRFRARNDPCPLDPDAARTCMRLRRFGAWTYGVSVLIYAVGFFFAFIAQHL